jgi:hypothetical protein
LQSRSLKLSSWLRNYVFDRWDRKLD